MSVPEGQHVMALPKPLPALPLTDTVPPLTLDSNAHVGDIVRYSLKIRSLSLEWASPLEIALGQLAQWLAEGGWLAEISASKRERISSEQTASSSIKPAQADLPATSADASVTSSTTGTIRAGNQQITTSEENKLISQLYTSIEAQGSGTKHVLLTVAPPPEAFVTREVDFQVIPGSLRCEFQPSLFHLPFFEDGDGNTRGEGGYILCGLDIDSDKPITPIGGTFKLHGLTAAREYQKLTDVLTIGAYTILSLSLELTLQRDSGVEMRYPVISPPEEISPPPPPPPASLGQKDRVKARAARAKEGLWSYLTKQSENIFKRGRTVSQTSSNLGLTPHQADGEGTKRDSTSLPPFTSALKGVKDSEGVLSTSPGIRFPPPILLTELAEREAKTGRSDINASQNAGLRSLLGWCVDHNLAGPRAFLRHQCITVLYSEYIPSDAAEQVDNEVNHSHSTTFLNPCIPRKWRTYQYYSQNPNEDQPLGQVVEEKCSAAEKACSGCKAPIRTHQLRWVTGRTRIIAEMHADATPTDVVTMWISCHECKVATSRQTIAHGTWLLSFGKYLELLAYSEGLSRLQTPLCEHTTISLSDPTDAIRCKANIIRNFAYKGYTMSFSNSPVQDVYEVQIPRLQITKGLVLDSQSDRLTVRDTWQKADKDKLRLEITHWWRGVKEHMGQLEEFLEGSSDAPLKKPLPPSPPPEKEDDENAITPKPIAKDLPPVNEDEIKPPGQPSATPSTLSTTSSATEDISSVARLANLRKVFNVTEQALYASLANTPDSLTNDVRRLFHSSAKAAANRLAAWETKHASGSSKHTPYPEPEWWGSGWHALPGGSVVIREGEWASIIAFTLSSSDYERELNEMSNPRATSSLNTEAGSTTSSVITSTTATSMASESTVTAATSVESSAPPSLTAFVTSIQAFAGTRSRAGTLDPDDESQASNWYHPENSTSQISRKEHPKEGSNILSLRDVLRNKAPADGTSINSTAGSKVSANVGPSAHGQPSLEIVTKDVHGSIQPLSPDAVDVFERILQEAEKDDYTIVDSLSSSPNDTIKVSTSSAATSTIAPGVTSMKPSMFAPPLPEKDFPTPLTSANATPMTEKSFSEANRSFFGSSSGHTNISDEAAVSAMGSLTSTIANAMRYVLSAGQGGSIERPLSVPPFFNLLAMDSPKIDSKPHIRYDCIIGKRLKFSCTIYYAKQFDSLRRRCGIHETLIESLKRTENWAAEGGKSKSNFWKTMDDRFIIKTLVNAWNVADLQVLIELGPSYFHYMDKTATKPSVMAKLLGFFTVELKNLETGAVQSKADLLVMENLFYQRTITQTFDLKGIEGRKVKPSSKGNPSKTMFDGEWLEGQKKALILLYPHSKTVLEEGIVADADFLASSNIMDYSLLLGVDPDRKHVACGLVDTIGSYTFAKTLEYKAKQNIRKEVTVIPPKEYRDRFVRAVNSYFVACPDKWSHPSPDYEFPKRLHSVL